MSERDELVAAALASRMHAYAPYSQFAVGAALRTTTGHIFAGCNVENAAYPLGTCAEAGAIAAMVAGGQAGIAEIVIAAAGPLPCTPCGGCRQRLREFAASDALVHMVDADGTLLITRALAALLPDSFGPQNLSK